jgi:hypothetical protein
MKQEFIKIRPEKFIKLFKYISYNVYSWCVFNEILIYENKDDFFRSKVDERGVLKNLLEDYEEKKRFVIPVIVFAKLVTFLIRFWNTFHDLNSEVFSTDYYQFLKIIPAKHGRRVVRFGSNNFSDKRLHYITDIINNLEKRGIDCGLSILPKQDAIKKDDEQKVVYGDFIYYLDAEDPKKHVTYSQQITNPQNYLESNFNNEEKKFIETTTELLQSLNIEELRAIGTHSNYNDTKYDIKKEYLDVYRNNKITDRGELSYLDNLIAKIKNDELFINEVKLVLSYIEEAFRKSHVNKKYYFSAYKKIVTEIEKKRLTNPLLEKAFKRSQEYGDDIWKDEITNVYLRKSKEFFLRMFYIYFIGYYQIEKKENPNSFKLYYYYTWKELLTQLKDHNLYIVKYNSINEYYVNNGTVLKREIKDQIIKMIELMKEWIKNMIINGK